MIKEFIAEIDKELKENEYIKKTIFLFSILLLPVLAGILLIPLPQSSCVFKELTGIPCPGCGGTRAIKSLLYGHFSAAIRYNILACYMSVFYVFYLITNTTYYLSHKKIPRIVFSLKYIYIGIFFTIMTYWA